MSDFRKWSPKEALFSQSTGKVDSLSRQCGTVCVVTSSSHYQHAVLPMDINLLPAVYVNQK